MSKKYFIGIYFLLVLFSSCQKENRDKLVVENVEIKQKVIAFLETKKQSVNGSIKQFISEIQESIEWNSVYINKGSFGVNQILLSLRKSLIINDSSINKNNSLILTENSSGSIILANIISITPLKSGNDNSNKLIADLINGAKPKYSGVLTKTYLNKRLSYQIGFDNGNSAYLKTVTKKNPITTVNNNTEACTDWYWMYYVGGVLVYEEYAYTTCDGPEGECEYKNFNGRMQRVNCPGSGGGGGAGTTSYNPCNEVNDQATNAAFLSKLDSLRQGWTNGYETGYTYTGLPSTGYNFTSYQGLPGQGVQLPTTGPPVRGMIHNHNASEPFSIFSPDDIRLMYQAYHNSNADSAFSFTLVTNNTAYTLKVNNLAAFTAFGQTHLVDQVNFVSFSFLSYNSYGINENNPPNSNELGFLKMLSGMNAGLKLFSASTDFQTWNLKGVDPSNPNNIATLNCL